MKGALGYILCLIAAIFLMREISGSGGLFIIILLGAALVFSTASLILTRRGISLGLSLGSGLVCRSESFPAKVTIERSSILPSCFIELELEVSPNITPRAPSLKYRLIAFRREGEELDIPLTADLCGLGQVRIKSAVLRDYLGIFSARLKELPPACEVGVMPYIPDAGAQSEILRSASESLAFDDSEEETDETSLALTGVPGYEHRAYIQGDPLKRINWKLSSKRDDLMVRLDEKPSASSQVILLDVPRGPEERSYYENIDLTVEASLSLVSMLLRAGFESEYYFFSGGWQCAEVGDEAALQLLQEQLARLTPCESGERLPPDTLMTKERPVLCFTSCTHEMTDRLEELISQISGTLVVTSLSLISGLSRESWEVTPEFEFHKTR